MTFRWLVPVVALGSVLCATSLPAVADDTGFAYMHDIRKERGRSCMSDHYHYGSGTGRTLAAAQRDAIGSWASFTALEYGSDWARWGRAAGKAQNCTKEPSGFNCSISARPCR